MTMYTPRLPTVPPSGSIPLASGETLSWSTCPDVGGRIYRCGKQDVWHTAAVSDYTILAAIYHEFIAQRPTEKPFVPAKSGDIQLANGSALYWQNRSAGTGESRYYYSDEVGGGVGVWDTARVSLESLLASILQEAIFGRLESEHARREKIHAKDVDEIGM